MRANCGPEEQFSTASPWRGGQWGKLEERESGVVAKGGVPLVSSTMRVLSLAALAILASLLLFHFSGSGPELREALHGEGVVQESAASEPGVMRLQQAALERAPVTLQLGEEVVVAASNEPQQAATDLRAGTVIVGEVLLIDERGVEQPGLSGEALCQLWSSDTSSFKRFTIDRGHFRLEVEGAEQFELRSLTLDGRTALPERFHELIDVEGHPILLRAVWPASITLSVFDALTEAHLDQVELRMCDTWPEAGLSVPSQRWSVRSTGNGRSPIVLEAEPEESRRSTCRFLVRSPGYAWRPVTLDMRTGGTYEVRLERACTLDVTIDGELPRTARHLSLYRRSGERYAPTAQVDVGRGRQHELTDLPSGDFDLKLETGGGYRDRASLGEVSFELLAGASRSVTLETKARPPVLGARLSGLVTIGEGWALEGLSVCAELGGEALSGGARRHDLSRKQLRRAEGVERTFLFDFGELQPGKYKVSVRNGLGNEAFDVGTTVQLGPDGLTDVALEVPPACRVQLTVTDSVSGEMVDCTVIWMRLGNQRRGGLRAMRGKPGAEIVEFLSPVGEFELITSNPEYGQVREMVTARPGLNSFSYQVDRACRVRLSLRDGEVSVPWNDELVLELSHAGSGQGPQTWKQDAAACTYTLAEPGRYLVASFELEGFEVVEGLEFDATTGETTEHVIELKRK